MEYGPIFNFDDLINGEDKDKQTKVIRSDLMDRILYGIPGVDKSLPTPQIQTPIVPPPSPETKQNTNAPIILPEMVIRAPKPAQQKITQQADIPTSRSKPTELIPFDGLDQGQDQEQKPQDVPQLQEQLKPFVDQELIDAQNQRRNMMLLQSLIRASNTVGTSIAGTKADPNYLKEFDPLISEPITSLQERRTAQEKRAAAERQAKLDAREEEKFGLEKEKMARDAERQGIELERIRTSMEDEKQRKDPNSLASQAVREFQKQRFASLSKISNGAIKYNPNAFDGMSAEQLENAFGKFSPENVATAVMSNERLREDARLRAQERADARAEKAAQVELVKEDKRRKELDSYIQKAQKDVSKDIEKIQKGRQELEMVKSAITNPSAVKDIGALYGMVKGFDPESAVREGELVLAAKGQSYMDQMKSLFSRMKANDTRVLQSGFLKQIAEYANEVQKIRETQYAQKMDARLKYASDRLGMASEEKEFIDPLFKDRTEKPKILKQKLYSPSRNQTKFIYDDGTEEIKDGKQ